LVFLFVIMLWRHTLISFFLYLLALPCVNKQHIFAQLKKLEIINLTKRRAFTRIEFDFHVFENLESLSLEGCAFDSLVVIDGSSLRELRLVNISSLCSYKTIYSNVAAFEINSNELSFQKQISGAPAIECKNLTLFKTDIDNSNLVKKIWTMNKQLETLHIKQILSENEVFEIMRSHVRLSDCKRTSIRYKEEKNLTFNIDIGFFIVSFVSIGSYFFIRLNVENHSSLAKFTIMSNTSRLLSIS
jgi:hypothetical protein